jgi:hypothetical protein
MKEPSGYVLETLWEDLEFVLSRGVHESELCVGAARAGERLEHAYALRDELDPAWRLGP